MRNRKGSHITPRDCIEYHPPKRNQSSKEKRNARDNSNYSIHDPGRQSNGAMLGGSSFFYEGPAICGASFLTVTDLKFSTACTTLSSLVVAPKIPPSILTESQVLTCRAGSPAAVPSSRSTQSNPRSFASLIVVETQTSVVTPAMTRFLMPLFRKRSSKSVWANALRPGLSITGSPRAG